MPMKILEAKEKGHDFLIRVALDSEKADLELEPALTEERPKLDEKGEPVLAPVLDEKGEPVRDEAGEPVMVTVNEIVVIKPAVRGPDPTVVREYRWGTEIPRKLDGTPAMTKSQYLAMIRKEVKALAAQEAAQIAETALAFEGEEF